MWRYNIKKIPNLKRNFSENVNKIIVIKKKCLLRYDLTTIETQQNCQKSYSRRLQTSSNITAS